MAGQEPNVYLKMSPGSDVDATAVKPAFAKRHGLTSTGDLKKLSSFRYGGPAENLARFQGAIGLRRVYGLRNMRYVSLPIPSRYGALDGGNNGRIPAATTKLPVHPARDLFIRRLRFIAQQGDGAHNHASRAVAALHGALIEKRLLDWMQCIAVS